MTRQTLLAKILLIICLVFVNSLAGAVEQNSILVSAAASLKNVLEQCGKMFEEKNPGVHVKFNFAASGALLGQINSGAPVDVFFSADLRDFARLKLPTADGDAATGQAIIADGYPKPFIGNELVFITPGKSTTTLVSIEELGSAGWKKIAIGNPASVPAGRYAEETLKSANICDALKDRLVLCENVRQVLDYVVRGEVDGGFVYRTDAATAGVGEVRQLLRVPAAKHSPIVYGVGRLSASGASELAEKFIAFVSQSECQLVFTNAGFIVPSSAAAKEEEGAK